MSSPQVHSVLKNASKKDIFLDPFPYLVIENALDKDLYEELSRTYPADSKVLPPNYKNNALYMLPAYKALEDDEITSLWKEFYAYHASKAFFLDVLNLFEDVILDLYPDFPELYQKSLREFETDIRKNAEDLPSGHIPADLTLDCQACMNSPVKEATSVRGPHVDNKKKLYAGLLYFRQPEDVIEGSDLVLYKYKDGKIPSTFAYNKIEEELLVPFKTVPYRPNTYIFYLNSMHSIHGVTPRGITPLTRRFVNTIGEVYSHPRGGMFEPPEAKQAQPARKSVFAMLGLR